MRESQVRGCYERYRNVNGREGKGGCVEIWEGEEKKHQVKMKQ